MSSNIPLLTIGVPVHNGENHIIECLENLANQNHQNFEVLVFENKSTDDTEQMVRDFCEKDTRFILYSSPEFLSMFDNFLRAFKGASNRGDFFALRAYDDFSSADYFDLLTKALIEQPTKALATSSVQMFEHSDGFGKAIEPKELAVDVQILLPENWGAFDRPFKRIVFPASWFYGVYRSSSSQTIFDALRNYPNMWAGDRLIVLCYLFAQKLAFVSAATFFCRSGSASYENYTEKGVARKIRARTRYFKNIWPHHVALRKKGDFSSWAYFMLCYKTSASDTTYSIENIIKSVLRIKK